MGRRPGVSGHWDRVLCGIVGGDYPWAAASSGLVGHTSTYPCVWCDVHKEQLGAHRASNQHRMRCSVRRRVQCVAGASVRIAAGESTATVAFSEAAECLSILIAGDVDAQGDALRASDALGVDGKFPLVVAAACATIIASKTSGQTIAAAARAAHAVVAAHNVTSWRSAAFVPAARPVGAAAWRPTRYRCLVWCS